MNKKNYYSVYVNLREVDFQILNYLYNLRCATLTQIVSLINAKRPTKSAFSPNYLRNRFIVLVKKSVIFKDSLKNKDNIFQITALGIECLREHNDVPNEIKFNDRFSRGYFTCNELKLSPPSYMHQLSLNDFIVSSALARLPLEPNTLFRVLFYHIFKPDGILSAQNTDIFLEMDMCTESKKVLQQKWERYKHYLSHYKQSKFNTLFFIINNTSIRKTNLDTRIAFARNTMFEEMITHFDGYTDAYVGSSEQLIPALKNTFEKRMLVWHWALMNNFFPYDTDMYDALFNNVHFDCLLVVKKMHLFCDYYESCRMSVFYKLLKLEQLSKLFYNSCNAEFHYMILLKEDEERIFYDHLRALNLYSILELPIVKIRKI